MVAEIAILLRLPRQRNFFDYFIPIEINQVSDGDLVEVPFRGQTQLGIVVRVKKNSTTVNLRSVNKVVVEKFINLQQLDLATKIAGHYGVALGQVFNLFTPVLPNRRFIPQSNKSISVVKKEKSNSWLFTYYDKNSRLQQIKKLCKQVTARGEQVIILAPDINNLKAIKAYIGPAYEWHSNLSTSEQQKVWSGVRSGEAKTIIATRSGLFLPFTKLGGILVDNSENENFKQSEQNPRYDSIEIAIWLKEIWSCSFAMFTSAPRLEDLARTKKKGWENISLGEPQPERFGIIDLRGRPNTDRYITPELISAISDQLVTGKKIFIYFNRRGTNTGVLCCDCGYLSRCPECNKGMVWHQQLGSLLCHTCGHKGPLPIPCPKCKGSNFYYLGTGLADLEKKVREIFLDKKIVRIDGDEEQKVPLSDIKENDIILGTTKAWPLVDALDFGLVAVTSLESELVVPEFRAVEFAWMRLRKFLSSTSGPVYVQTFNPDMDWFQYVTSNPSLFLEYSMKERLQFKWPPAVELLRLTAKNSSEQDAKNQLIELAVSLKKFLSGQETTIIGPYPDYYIKDGRKFIYHLLLKYDEKFKAETLWNVLPTDVIVDRHPRFILS